MDFAHDSGLPTLSGIVKLVQETEEDVQMRFLMFNPVYTNGKPIQTTEQRREALEGFVYSSFRVNKFMDGILGPTNQDITFRIFDSKLESENLMYDHSQIKEIKQSEINLSVNKRILIKVE